MEAHDNAAAGPLAELEAENQRLRRSVAELSVLAEIASAVGQEPSLQAVIELIVHKAVRAVGVEQGTLYLLTELDQQKTFETLWREARSSTTQLPLKLGDQVIGWMLQHQRPLEVNDLAADVRFPGLDPSQLRIRSLLAVPLRFKARLIGLLVVYNKKIAAGFSEDDRRLLGIVAGHAAPVLETARLIGELRQDQERLLDENSQLKREITERFSASGVIGTSQLIQQVLRLIDQIRDTDVDVLISGEAGTGKELFARTIHYSSRRARRPFVVVNCAAPEGVIETELLGAEPDIVGAGESRAGQFEAANKGTLFLDEVGELPLPVQEKVVRVLEERVVQRLGSREPVKVEVRVIAATTNDLEASVESGSFRKDLYDRLNVVQLRTPALRATRDDIAPLANHFLSESAKQLGREDLSLSPAAMACFENAPWPGNVRQLQNEVKRAALCAPRSQIHPTDLSEEIRAAGSQGEASTDLEQGAPIEQALASYERRLLEEALARHEGDPVRTAASLGLDGAELSEKMLRLGLAPKDPAA